METPYKGQLRYQLSTREVSNAPKDFVGLGLGTREETVRTLQQFDGTEWKDVPDAGNKEV